MKNLKVSMKLIVSFLIVTALTVVIGVLGIFSLNTAADNSGTMADATDMAIAAARMNRNIQAQRASFRGAAVYHLAGDMEQRDQNIADVSTLENDFDSFHAIIEPLLISDEAFRLFGAIDEAVVPFEAARGAFIDTFSEPDITNEEMVTRLNAVASTVAPVANAITAFVDFADNAGATLATQADTTAQSTTIIMIVVLAVIVIIAMLLAFYISRLISKPLNAMMGYIKQAGETGNLQFTETQWQNCDRLSKGKDEIGQTMNAFTKMLRKFVYYGDVVKQVAAKDLTLTVETLGNDDTFGNAITQMLDDLNLIFTEISSATVQVNTGSSQIADGAQTLAQGSTEQAASVQELSASIAEIADKTKANAQRANDAAKLAASIMQNAEKGSHQMEDMIGAVEEINRSGQEIYNVMKSIEKLSRQINMLSLNASVEAARAGVHGKGFAVVADAVRQLAVQSAEVAQESGDLIANSIEKAELGAQIANETAASFGKIVAGIGDSSRITHEIATSSEEQSVGIAQVNDGIEQVAQVVQQNSATAEQSAAASEELSGQSSVLKELVSQFKLRDKKAEDGAKRLMEPQIENGYNRNSDTAFALRGALAITGKY